MDKVKLLSARTGLLITLILLFVLGLAAFAMQYFDSAPAWVEHPSNRHFYTDGKLSNLGTIYDRGGKALLQMSDGGIKYNEDPAIRTALMHVTGDRDGNVETSISSVFKSDLMGWNWLNGAYRFNSEQPTGGTDLTLTLDAGLCAAAYRELRGRRGAVGVYNYQTGELICMTSSPSFDPVFPPDLTGESGDYEGVYLNRLFSAAYTPGSVFKLVTTAAALEQLPDIDKRRFRCNGEMEVEGNMVTCPAAHGELTLGEALAHSCNTSFARIALELGAEKLQEYAERVGFNSAQKVDGIHTIPGRVELAHAGKAGLAWAGIGQFTNTANPLNFMSLVGVIGNRGLAVAPNIVARRGFLPAASAGAKKRLLSENTAEALAKMMRNNTIAVYGESNFKGLELCAKSGTAEVGEGKKPHSWFAGFLDRSDYPLAFVVIIEGGGSGSGSAAAVASAVLHRAVK